MEDHLETGDVAPQQDRREFLAKWGRFAVITPPVVTLMLTGSANGVVASSSGFPYHGRRGWGHRHHHGRGHGHHRSPKRGRGHDRFDDT